MTTTAIAERTTAKPPEKKPVVPLLSMRVAFCFQRRGPGFRLRITRKGSLTGPLAIQRAKRCLRRMRTAIQGGLDLPAGWDNTDPKNLTPEVATAIYQLAKMAGVPADKLQGRPKPGSPEFTPEFAKEFAHIQQLVIAIYQFATADQPFNFVAYPASEAKPVAVLYDEPLDCDRLSRTPTAAGDDDRRFFVQAMFPDPPVGKPGEHRHGDGSGTRN